MLAFELVGGEEALDDLHRERLVDLVVVHCEASFRHTAAVALGQTVYALLQDEGELDRRRVTGLAQRIGTHAEERLGTPLLAAVGSTVEGVREVARARREAERVLGVLRVDARGRTVAAIEDVQSEVVLLELRELSADHPGLARGKLERVLAHDAEHGSGYVATLRAYLDAFGDVSKAAAPDLRPSEHVPLPDAPPRRAVRARPRRTRRSASSSSCSSACSRADDARPG